MSDALQIQFITSCSRQCQHHKPQTHTDTRIHTHNNACTQSYINTQHSQGHESPQSLTLPSLCEKEYWKYALRNSGEEVGFSHFHPRLADVFLRESRAVQARSFHYHSEKALHETLPGKQGRLLVIFLPYYCQNLLYFTFYSRRPFSYYIPIAFVLSLSHLNAEMFGVL